MASIKSTERSSTLVNRLDDVQMSASDREHGKVMMRQAEAFAEAVAGLHERIRLIPLPAAIGVVTSGSPMRPAAAAPFDRTPLRQGDLCSVNRMPGSAQWPSGASH